MEETVLKEFRKEKIRDLISDEFMTALCELHSIGEVLALYITPEDSLVVDGLEDPDCDQEEEEG